MTIMRRIVLAAIVGLVASACLEEGDRCANACRAQVDCDISKITTATSADRRELMQDCKDRCVSKQWSESMTTCLNTSEGYCIYVNECQKKYGENSTDSDTDSQ